MKYIKSLLELAKIRDISKSADKNILTKINKDFDIDTRLVFDIYIKNSDKHIIIKWNNTEIHPMLDRIKTRTSFKSISEFNFFIEKVFNELFDNHFKEIDNDGRYALYLKVNNFYILVDIIFDNLFSKYTHFYIATINLSSPGEDCYKIIEIDDDYF